MLCVCVFVRVICLVEIGFRPEPNRFRRVKENKNQQQQQQPTVISLMQFYCCSTNRAHDCLILLLFGLWPHSQDTNEVHQQYSNVKISKNKQTNKTECITHGIQSSAMLKEVNWKTKKKTNMASRNNEMSFCPVFFLTVHISSYFRLCFFVQVNWIDIFAQIFRSLARPLT